MSTIQSPGVRCYYRMDNVSRGIRPWVDERQDSHLVDAADRLAFALQIFLAFSVLDCVFGHVWLIVQTARERESVKESERHVTVLVPEGMMTLKRYMGEGDRGISLCAILSFYNPAK